MKGEPQAVWIVTGFDVGGNSGATIEGERHARARPRQLRPHPLKSFREAAAAERNKETAV